MEIERKWLMSGYPTPEQATLLRETLQKQSYVTTAPVVRIRSEEITHGENTGTKQYILCFKSKGTLARTEIETPVSEDVAARLMAFCEAAPITKRNRLYLLPDGHKLECSLVDEGTVGAFYYAEIEFDTVEEAKAYTAPDFFGAEKTYDPTFSMSRLWLRHLNGVAEALPADGE